jgi:hypothetical protein
MIVFFEVYSYLYMMGKLYSKHVGVEELPLLYLSKS